MQSNRGRDTKLEIELRRALHRAGLRFWKHRRPLEGVRCEADILFPRLRLVVLVDGCFWHCCPEHKSLPAVNRDWWTAKLQGNATRDRQNDQLLRDAAWTVVRLWEHESTDEMVAQVLSTVQALRSTLSVGSKRGGPVTRRVQQG